MIPKTAKLFGADGKLVKELDIPADVRNYPDVIFYGIRAFHSLLMGRGQYHECTCWRAPEPQEERPHLGEAG